uniref:Uncharacterized protein n=1 Tax=Bionectria ochroleuca TaxID=29856 RepID=A0A8H7KBH9_BIOOC
MPQSLDCDFPLSFSFLFGFLFFFISFISVLFFLSYCVWFSFVSKEIFNFTGIVYNHFYFHFYSFGIYSLIRLRRPETAQREAVLVGELAQMSRGGISLPSLFVA